MHFHFLMDSTREQASQIARHGSQLTQNLRVGIGLALFQRTSAHHLVASLDQLVILILFNASMAVLFDFIQAGGKGAFYQWGLATLSLTVLSLLLACLLISKASKNDDLALRLPLLLLTLYLPLQILSSLQLVWLRHEQTNLPNTLFAALSAIAALWILAVVVWILYSICNLCFHQVLLSLILLSLATLAPRYYFPIESMWWQADQEEAEAGDNVVEWITHESTFYEQAEMLPAHLSRIQQGTPHHTELYFLGMAPYASQDVFIKEIQSVSALFAERFEARGKSVVLANHKQAWHTTPLASMTSLKASLNAIGAAMNREDDLLFLYITTHGSRTHELSVQLSPLQLAAITPATLANAIKESGIKWKVIVISACYAGGFIDPLKDDYTLIMTAADATHTSFGCGNQFEYTYFGEALFKEELSRSYSFVRAFENARRSIAAREAAEQLTPSNPQMHAPPAMKMKLEGFEQELQARAIPVALKEQPAEAKQTRSQTVKRSLRHRD